MDLGLHQLTDDQLMNLLQEVCGELATRDPMVRNAAQQTIFDEGEKLDATKRALREAVEAAKAEYRKQIKQEALDAVRAAVASGEIVLLSSAEEGKAVAEATLEAKLALIDEAMEAVRKGGSVERFFFEIRPGLTTVSYGSRRVEARHSLNSQAISALADHLRKLLTET